MDKNKMEELKFKYIAALKVLETKLEIINDEFNQSNSFNPIEHIKTRIKSDESIYNKLKKEGYNITEEKKKKKIHDIAGIRIVCSFLSDIERIENLIRNDKDLKIIRRKDYINNPKQTGYSSIHLTVLVPVTTLDKVEYVGVEIQIRTIAMDMWASLEHKLLYKSHKEYSEDLQELMRDFSTTTKNIDKVMEYMIKESSNNYKVGDITKEEIRKAKKIEDTPMLKYELARNLMKEKIENLNYELAITKDSNPIEHIKTRIKKPRSIVRKLEKSNYEISEENMKNHVHDLIGIRIVCSFLSDLYEIKDILESDSTLNIIKEKDYINNPKPNGYRSYHINAIIPVNMIDRTEYVEAEIQLRTLAMDMWASLEHKISYEKNGEIPNYITEQLKDISNRTYEIDSSIENIINNQNKILSNNKVKKLSLAKKSICG